MSLVAPFIPAIENLKGSFDVDLAINGQSLETIKYSGNITLNKSEFTLLANNMVYSLEGRCGFLITKKLQISKLDLYNSPKDLPKGRANIKGEILLEGFSPKMFDISLTTPRLLVLNQASMKSNTAGKR